MSGNLGAKSVILALAVMVMTASGHLLAEPTSENKPFADKFLLLQLSDGEPEKQDKVLSVAANLLEHYGPDLIDIEITTFGPGVRLMYTDNARTRRIESLMAQGVRFTVCMNTIDTIERTTGTRPDTHPDSIPVAVGVAHIIEKVEEGYVLVRP